MSTFFLSCGLLLFCLLTFVDESFGEKRCYVCHEPVVVKGGGGSFARMEMDAEAEQMKSFQGRSGSSDDTPNCTRGAGGNFEQTMSCSGSCFVAEITGTVQGESFKIVDHLCAEYSAEEGVCGNGEADFLKMWNRKHPANPISDLYSKFCFCNSDLCNKGDCSGKRSRDCKPIKDIQWDASLKQRKKKQQEEEEEKKKEDEEQTGSSSQKFLPSKWILILVVSVAILGRRGFFYF